MNYLWRIIVSMSKEQKLGQCVLIGDAGVTFLVLKNPSSHTEPGTVIHFRKSKTLSFILPILHSNSEQ